MKVVLDTNVFISGVFFSGPPHRILRAWREGRLRIVYSTAILEEYRRVFEEFGRRLPKAHPEAILQFLGVYGELIQPGEATMGVCRDPDDEKFIDCFLAAKADWLVSGDRDLLELEDRRVRVLSPRAFCDRFL